MRTTIDELIKSAKALGSTKTVVFPCLMRRAKEQEEALKEVWQILNVLSMCAMDDGTPYPKALSWLKEWEHLGYPQPKLKEFTK